MKALKERGVLLAVCSKNEDHIAKEVFLKHPEMALHLDDISSFVANWNDKAANLREIARQLNIGVNSLVFADDNPAERSIVRQLAPDVAVPDLPDDPAEAGRTAAEASVSASASFVVEDIELSRLSCVQTQTLSGLPAAGARFQRHACVVS